MKKFVATVMVEFDDGVEVVVLKDKKINPILTPETYREALSVSIIGLLNRDDINKIHQAGIPDGTNNVHVHFEDEDEENEITVTVIFIEVPNEDNR